MNEKNIPVPPGYTAEKCNHAVCLPDRDCAWCAGTGIVIVKTPSRLCPDCGGKGAWSYDFGETWNECFSCHGTGWLDPIKPDEATRLPNP